MNNKVDNNENVEYIVSIWANRKSVDVRFDDPNAAQRYADFSKGTVEKVSRKDFSVPLWLQLFLFAAFVLFLCWISGVLLVLSIPV